MFQQKDNEDFESDGSVLKIRDSTLTPKNKKEKIHSDSDLIEKPVEKKSFAERWKTHRFWLVKGLYYLLHTIWMIVMIVGGFIAWLISLLFI